MTISESIEFRWKMKIYSVVFYRHTQSEEEKAFEETHVSRGGCVRLQQQSTGEGKSTSIVSSERLDMQPVTW